MKTYLVALDSSPVARDVLTAAMELGAKTDARLVLLRAVTQPEELPPQVYEAVPGNLVGLLLETALKDLAALQQNLARELVAETVVKVGVPWQVICEEASARGVDLIVMGTHGHKFLDRLLGTVTQRVVAHAQQSVLIVWPRVHGGSR